MNFTTNINKIPTKKARKCKILFRTLQPCFTSGIKSELAMYIKFPAANGNKNVIFIFADKK